MVSGMNGTFHSVSFSSFLLSFFLLSVRSCQLTVKIIRSGERAQITTATAAERKTENGNGWENTENGKEGETYQKEYSKNKLIKRISDDNLKTGEAAHNRCNKV